MVRPLSLSLWSTALAVPVLVMSVVMLACGRPEDPARAELRERLKQKSSLSSEELGRVRTEVGRAIENKLLRINEGGVTRELTPEQRTVVLGMLTYPAGMFDEGLREAAGATFRVLNAPGDSANAEIEASRKLWIDLETFLPRRFEFVYAFPGYGDYSYDLTVE